MTDRGIYFHQAQLELATVLDADGRDLGAGWIRLSPDPTCGLIGARKLLVERGLADQATAQRVFWRMDSTAPGADVAAA